jgi:FAD/FMN-containing dehydrogenase
VTGGCECTSLLGPGLGGGHGFLQGRHGLIADQFVSMNIVLANGDLRTIDKTSDLWWAMQGAGHNFGIVTSVTSKIYDVQYPDWAYASFIFTGDKVEGLYSAINKYLLKDGRQPVYIINYSFFFNDPTLDPNKVCKTRYTFFCSLTVH